MLICQFSFAYVYTYIQCKHISSLPYIHTCMYYQYLYLFYTSVWQWILWRNRKNSIAEHKLPHKMNSSPLALEKWKPRWLNTSSAKITQVLRVLLVSQPHHLPWLFQRAVVGHGSTTTMLTYRRMQIRSDTPCGTELSQHQAIFRQLISEPSTSCFTQCLPMLCSPPAGGELGKNRVKGRSWVARNKALHKFWLVVTTAIPAAVPPLTKARASYLSLSSQFYHLHFNKNSLKLLSELTHGASYAFQHGSSFCLILLDFTLKPGSAPTTAGDSKSWRDINHCKQTLL